jgi:hypothetical protein
MLSTLRGPPPTGQGLRNGGPPLMRASRQSYHISGGIGIVPIIPTPLYMNSHMNLLLKGSWQKVCWDTSRHRRHSSTRLLAHRDAGIRSCNTGAQSAWRSSTQANAVLVSYIKLSIRARNQLLITNKALAPQTIHSQLSYSDPEVWIPNSYPNYSRLAPPWGRCPNKNRYLR